MNLQEIKNTFITVMNELYDDDDHCDQEYVNQMNQCKTYNEVLLHVADGLDESDYDSVVERVLGKAIEPDIPDWNLAYDDIMAEDDTPDHIAKAQAFMDLKENYALLRYNMGKMDGYASEAIYALEQIDTLSNYTDFDPDQLDADLNHVQTFITEWQETMRIIP